MQTAARHTLPLRSVVAHKPWIRSCTLQLIELRNQARLGHQSARESVLNRNIRLSAKADRREWLNDMLRGGSWAGIRKLCRATPRQQGRLKNSLGEIVQSDERAQTMAEYLENVQWMAPPASRERPHGPQLGPTLPVKVEDFTMEELTRVLQKLKGEKAPGADNINPELWKALGNNEEAADILLDLCNRCWREKTLPEAWRLATISCLFKKGDVGLPCNYRPISLLSVGYKVLASMLHSRIVNSGAEKRLRDSHYGFRKGRGTAEAIFLVQRQVEQAWAKKDGKLSIVFLDWAKAFDRVCPTALSTALLRFGLPSEMVDMVVGIYLRRSFTVAGPLVNIKRENAESRHRARVPVEPVLIRHYDVRSVFRC